MAKGYVEHAYESAPGNEVNSPTLGTKKLTPPLLEFEPTLNPSPMERDDENRNTDEPVPVLEEQHNPSWRAKNRAYPDVLGFLLKGMLGNPVTTAGAVAGVLDPDSGVIPVSAHRHVWTAPFGPTGPSPQTQQLTASYADQGVYFRLKGAATEKLDISVPASGGVQVDTSGPAAFLQRLTTDPAVVPAYEALTVQPFKRAGLVVTWLGGSAASEDFTLSIEQTIAMVRSMGVASMFPDIVEKDEGPVLVTGSIPKRQLSAVDFDALKAATGFVAKAKFVSDSIITGSTRYGLWIEFENAQYVGGQMDALMNKRRHGASFNFKGTRNLAASVKITLVNATPSYA